MAEEEAPHRRVQRLRLLELRHVAAVEELASGSGQRLLDMTRETGRHEPVMVIDASLTL